MTPTHLNRLEIRNRPYHFVSVHHQNGSFDFRGATEGSFQTKTKLALYYDVSNDPFRVFLLLLGARFYGPYKAE